MNGLDAERWRRAEPIFDAALDLAPAERAAFVAAACAGDPDLRAAVERLLAADAAAGDFLAAPFEARAPELLAELADDGVEEVLALAGQRIGPFRVVAELGRGGMGAVYLAERADGQFDQQVALKVIRRGMDSADLLRRFLRERRILARLEHPAIARLLDGGVTADGQPWFALEYVAGGEPITAWCAARGEDVEGRLALFSGVCRAVDFAHRNLVVHRDLKPGNVLVTAGGEVKLLDFGIAKLLAAEAEDDATLAGPLPLTPPYAAPEQLAGRPVTTATDVYGLGALLYELLTGERPRRPGGSSLEEHRRAALDRDPEPPSRIAPRQLARRLRGDLDAIVLHALEREPERRYPSVAALLDDLERHRAGLPIAARRAGIALRAGRFVRRHKVGVAAAALVALSLAAGVAGTVWQAREAVSQARRAEAVREFVLSLFEVADPNATAGVDLTARELLDRGARRIDAELAGQPAMRAEMLAVVGDIYRRLGTYDRARELLERSLAVERAARHPDAARIGEALLRLADVHHSAGDLDLAQARYGDALAALGAGLGADHPSTLRAASYRARLAFDRGDYDAAEAGLAAALAGQRRALGEDHPETVASENALAQVAFARGDLAAAGPRFERVLAARRRLHGELHSEVSEALVNVATVHDRLGDLDRAEALYREALAIDRQLAPGHPDLAVDLNNLAALLTRKGELAEAETLGREALALAESAFGADRPATAPYLHNLANTLHRRGADAEAEPLARRALALAEGSLGPDHEHAALARASHARILAALGRAAEAAAAFRQALAVLEARLPADDPRLAEAREDAARLRGGGG